MRKYSADKQFWKRQRPDGSFGDDWQTSIGGKRVSTKTSNLAAARRFKARREIERADPRHAAAEAATLADGMKDLYADIARRGRSEATRERAKQKLGHFPRIWGEKLPMAAIDARKVADYIDARLADSYATTGIKTPKRITIRDELAFLRQMLTLARRHGYYPLHVDDVMPINFETGHKPKKDFATAENLEKILSKVEPRHAAHLLFFVITAGRLADSYRAERGDFNTASWTALVRGSKTDGSYRTIPILEHLRPYVTRMLHDAEPNLLFLPWDNIHRDLRGACDRAKVPRVTTNGLRRTFGKLARVHGYTLDTISKLFGHTTEKLVRDVYADIDGDDLRAVVDREREAARTKTVQAH